MSNKNTRRLNESRAAAAKAGESEYAEMVPTSGYHSGSEKGTFAPRRLKTTKGAGTVSTNRRRNMSMVVSHNEDANGKKTTLTEHVPLVRDIPVIYKNKSYLHSDEHKDNQYRQPKYLKA